MDSGWLKLLDLSGPVVIACFATCAGVTYGYENEIFLLSFMPVVLVVIANIGVFFFGALSVVWVVRWIKMGVLWAFRAFTFNKSVVEQLDSLSEQERQFLRSLLDRNQSHYTTSLTHPATATLIHRGLVQRGMGQHSVLEYPHFIPSGIWKVIKKNVDRV